MIVDITGNKIALTDGIEEYANKKLKKLNKFFDDDTIAHVTYSAKREKQNVDIRIEYKGKTYLAEEPTENVYAGIDLAIDKILGQLRKDKTKMMKRRSEKPINLDL